MAKNKNEAERIKRRLDRLLKIQASKSADCSHVMMFRAVTAHEAEMLGRFPSRKVADIFKRALIDSMSERLLVALKDAAVAGWIDETEN